MFDVFFSIKIMMAYQQNGDLTSKTGNFTRNNGDFFEW
jgi:hypothetical protein